MICIQKLMEQVDDPENLDLVTLIAQVSLKQRKVYGFIQKMKQTILMQILLIIIILNLLNIRLRY